MRSSTDYRMAKRALVRRVSQGSVAVADVCDAHPELLRAARNIGTPSERRCPICALADRRALLDVRAAVRAGRAVERGGGYAVVATEVRKLAERSQESAGQIQAIVTQIQAETSATILASEEGAKEVHTGSALAREVVDALERISGMVDETTTAAKEISIATQQQRSASDQVVSAMTQVSDVSRQYAVGSKQAAAAAAQLNVLAAELRSSIEQFRVS